MKIKGSTVLVTGASSGIGEATAKALARKGARTVLLLARTEESLHRIAKQITDAGGSALPFPVDLSNAQAAVQVVENIIGEFGTPDILINNAGVGRWLFVEETSPEEAVQMMAIPYFAAFYATRAFLPGMLQRKSGHIVNVTSVGAFRAIPGAAAYTASRWAMRGFSEGLSAELHGTGIDVSLFASGTVLSSYFDNNPGTYERMPKLARLIRELTPEEAADAIVRGIERKQQLIVIPTMMKLFMFFNIHFPGLFRWLMIQTGYKRS